VEKKLNTPSGFRSSYDELHPLAVAAAQRVLRDQAAAEDVAQDVFIALWRNPKAYDPKRGSLRSYVSLMARSRALDRWRTRQAREAAVDRSAAEQKVRHVEEESAAEPVLRRDRSRRILHALDSLPGEQREAVLLAFGRGLTAQEIAKAIGVPLGTAKSRVRLGLQKARTELQAA
jgi:RNA polymerase sigma-70 factor, ECF subfamily